jgi:DNA-binding NarL/FixJ family response regulator
MQEIFRVLICEPSEIVAIGVTHALQRCEQLEVVGSVSSLADAIATIGVCHPDVVVVDPELSDASGFEAVTRLAALSPRIRILVLSGRADEEYVSGAFMAGANGYCLKNIFSTYLMSAVYSIAIGAAWLDKQIADMILPRADRPVPIRSTVYKLSEREAEVLALVVEGLSNKQIAVRLQLSQTTVKTYLRTLFRKLGVRDRSEAASYALKEKLL